MRELLLLFEEIPLHGPWCFSLNFFFPFCSLVNSLMCQIKLSSVVFFSFQVQRCYAQILTDVFHSSLVPNLASFNYQRWSSWMFFLLSIVARLFNRETNSQHLISSFLFFLECLLPVFCLLISALLLLLIVKMVERHSLNAWSLINHLVLDPLVCVQPGLRELYHFPFLDQCSFSTVKILWSSVSTVSSLKIRIL